MMPYWEVNVKLEKIETYMRLQRVQEDAQFMEVCIIAKDTLLEIKNQIIMDGWKKE